MDHVVLGDQPDAVAQRRVLGMQVMAVETHLACGRGEGPPTNLANVDLPAPDGPMIVVSDPGRALRRHRSTAGARSGNVKPSACTSRQSTSATTGGPASRSTPSSATRVGAIPVSRAAPAGSAEPTPAADVESSTTPIGFRRVGRPSKSGFAPRSTADEPRLREIGWFRRTASPKGVSITPW